MNQAKWIKLIELNYIILNELSQLSKVRWIELIVLS